MNIVDEETGDRSDSQEGNLAQPSARVQPLRLTFDENNEPVLVVNEENQASVQIPTLDEDNA